MGENIISFNITNWITVLIIVGTTYAVIGFLMSLLKAKRQNAS